MPHSATAARQGPEADGVDTTTAVAAVVAAMAAAIKGSNCCLMA